jgi:hypothetical protein
MCSRLRSTTCSEWLRKLALALALALPFVAGADARGADIPELGAIAVVVRSDASVRSTGRDEGNAVFVLDQRQNFQPLDLPETDPIRAAFYMRLAKENLTMMRALHSTLVFTGNGRPPKQLELSALLARLAGDHNAIAYLPALDLPAGLHSVASLPAEP